MADPKPIASALAKVRQEQAQAQQDQDVNTILLAKLKEDQAIVQKAGDEITRAIGQYDQAKIRYDESIQDLNDFIKTKKPTIDRSLTPDAKKKLDDAIAGVKAEIEKVKGELDLAEKTSLDPAVKTSLDGVKADTSSLFDAEIKYLEKANATAQAQVKFDKDMGAQKEDDEKLKQLTAMKDALEKVEAAKDYQQMYVYYKVLESELPEWTPRSSNTLKADMTAAIRALSASQLQQRGELRKLETAKAKASRLRAEYNALLASSTSEILDAINNPPEPGTP